MTGPSHGGSHPYEILDVFTDTPLEGNPLAVFTEGEQVPSRLMQAVARELHLSETVFLLPDAGANPGAEADAHVRIFTPAAELPFAGHPVLGSAFVVAGRTGRDRVRLRTGAGIVQVTLTRDDTGAIVFGEMEQPIPTVKPFPHPDALLAALGVGADSVQLPVELYDNGPTHVMVALADAETVAALTPDLAALARLDSAGGFSCFAPEAPHGPASTYRTRMFAPSMGVSEDPATGSAAGPLAVHLLRHGRTASGETVELHQGLELARPSTLHATATGTPDAITRVTVGGCAVAVAHGHFRLQ